MKEFYNNLTIEELKDRLITAETRIKFYRQHLCWDWLLHYIEEYNQISRAIKKKERLQALKEQD